MCHFCNTHSSQCHSDYTHTVSSVTSVTHITVCSVTSVTQVTVCCVIVTHRSLQCHFYNKHNGCVTSVTCIIVSSVIVTTHIRVCCVMYNMHHTWYTMNDEISFLNHWTC